MLGWAHRLATYVRERMMAERQHVEPEQAQDDEEAMTDLEATLADFHRCLDETQDITLERRPRD